MKPPLCLNMIVKNEAARIERCLNSVTATVKAAYILDTGSTDDTIAKIYAWGAANDIEVAIETAPFENFSQARNEAFRWARSANRVASVSCQFALLVDADMELVVDDPYAFNNLDANAPAYDMIQKGGVVAYANRRLLNLNIVKAPYVGVTHEYIDVPAAAMIEGAWFRDHADGSNRVNKYARDAQLLEADLLKDPNNGRSLYYLGNTYRDAGDPLRAVDAYQKRIALGGWDEETHSAMMNLACAYKDLGLSNEFIVGTMAAYNFRPSRAEPLYDLAKYFREKGDTALALMFSKMGLTKKKPNDLLFVNEHVYNHGLRYEYSIAGYYDEAERPGAFEATNALALDPTCPAEFRSSARTNLFWHLKPLSAYCPSFVSHRLMPKMPVGYTATNPSVEVDADGVIRCNVRGVNYTINEHGQYVIGGVLCGDAPIDTRNVLCTLNPDTLQVSHQREILWHRPPAAWGLVTGLEDIRLWRYRGELNFSATVREQNAGGYCEMIRGRLGTDIDDNYMTVIDWHRISEPERTEKNWMPMPADQGRGPRFVYRLNRIIEPDAMYLEANELPVYVDEISGSSQLIEFKGGYLAVVHEAGVDPTTNKRTYWHRFAWFDSLGVLRRLSLPFVFYDRQIEFCAGLAAHPNNSDLLISFGVRDAEAHVAAVNIEQVSTMLWKVLS